MDGSTLCLIAFHSFCRRIDQLYFNAADFIGRGGKIWKRGSIRRGIMASAGHFLPNPGFLRQCI